MIVNVLAKFEDFFNVLKYVVFHHTLEKRPNLMST